MSLTQRSSARYMARPDATHLDFNPNTTALQGLSRRTNLDLRNGTWQGSLSVDAASPGFEVSDLGFQNTVDRVYKNAHFGGEEIPRDPSLALDATPTSRNGFSLRVACQFASWNDRLTRGGPLSRDPAGYPSDISANTDSRRTRQVRTEFQFSGDDSAGSRRSANLNATLQIREVRLGSNRSRSVSPAESVTKVIAPEATHTFGHRYVTSDPRPGGFQKGRTESWTSVETPERSSISIPKTHLWQSSHAG